MTDQASNTPADGGKEDPRGAFEERLFQCIEAYTHQGVDAVEEICKRHPAEAPRLQARLSELQRMGLLGEPAEARGLSRIDQYRILARLGHGGMAVVYLAEDTRIGRRVALKLGRVPIGADDRSRERFEREVRAASELRHPNIVPIHDVGEFKGQPYFTMEYVEGATLAQVLEAVRTGPGDTPAPTVEDLRETTHRVARAVRSQAQEEEKREQGSHGEGKTTETDSDPLGRDTAESLAWGQTWIECVARIVLDIADALQHAHEHGIVHRDVNPSNILVRTDGRAQLFDLGLAHRGDLPTLTRTGDFAGTPSYMAPEQIRGHHGIDARTDVYGLGVTLYELLTFERPFRGDNTAEVLHRIQSREPTLPRKLNPGVPRDLETLCATAMAKDPRHRYGGMGELAADLRRFLSFAPVHAVSIGTLRRGLRFLRSNPPLALAASLALLIAIGLPIGLGLANRAIRRELGRTQVAEQEANWRADLNDQQLDLLLDSYELSAEDEVGGEGISAREILDRGAVRALEPRPGEPRVQAAMLVSVGRGYANLGLHEEAIPLLDRAFAIENRVLGEHHFDGIEVLRLLAQTHHRAGNSSAAAALAKRALGALDISEGPSEKDRGRRGQAESRLRVIRCRALGALGESKLALAEAEQALAALQGVGLAEGVDAIEPHDAWAEVAESIGEAGLAERHLRQAIDLIRLHTSGAARDLVPRLRRLAAVVESPEEAESLAEEATALARHGDLVRGPGSGVGSDPGLPFEIDPSWRAAYRSAFQEGIIELQAQNYGTAIEAFERCLVENPSAAVPAYNIACCHGLLGNIDQGVEAFERAVDSGFGYRPGRLETAAGDPELSEIREHPRGRAALERMRSRAAAAEEFSSEAAVHVPARLGPGRPPLLVVLHRDGATKFDVVAGPWRALADEMGAVLLAPSASSPLDHDPEAGMVWIDDASSFARRPWTYEDPIHAAVRRHVSEHDIDRDQIVIIGEGIAGLLAFDIAIRSPGFYAGVLVLNGPLPPGASLARGRSAATVGVRASYVLEGPDPFFGEPPSLPRDELRERVEAWFGETGLGGSDAVRFELEPRTESQRWAVRTSRVSALLMR